MAGEQRLDGWKAIAAHLGRGVRTVQRWERDFDLPVRRLAGRGEVVMAFAHELDEWVARMAAARSGQDGATPAPLEQPTDHAAVTPQPPLPPRATGNSRRLVDPQPSRRSWRLAVPVLGLAIVLAGAWFIAGRVRNASGATDSKAARAIQPVTWRVEQNALAAVGADGRVLWTKTFGVPLEPQGYAETRSMGRSLAMVADIDGDGANEVLFAVPVRAQDAGAEGLYVFASDGTLRYHYRPAHRVQYGPYLSVPPWYPYTIRLGPPEDGIRSVWLVSVSTFYPSVLERIGPDGKPTSQYWSDGFIDIVVPATLEGRPVLLVGGSNNEYKGGALAVLDARAPNGTAPAIDDAYRCTEGCRSEAPLAFAVWPASPLHREIGGTEPAWELTFDSAGQIVVTTGTPGGPMPATGSARLAGNRCYVLDAHLRLASAELGMEYRAAYDYLRRARPMMPPFFDSSLERHLFPMLRWEHDRFVRVNGPELARRAAPAPR